MRTFLHSLACVSVVVLCAVARAKDKEVWVASYFQNKVTRFNVVTGAKLGELTGISGPLGMTLHGGKVFVTAETANKIRMYDPETAAYLGDFATANLNHPTAIAFNPAGDLFAANFNDNSVSRFNSAGVYLGRFVTNGLGGLNGPDLGMAFGPDGDLYIPSYYGNSVLRYDGKTGASKGEFIAAGLGGLTQPRTLVWRDGLLYVTSDNGGKLLRYNAQSGSFVSTFVPSGSGGLGGAVGMAFVGESVLITSGATSQVLQYNATTGAYSKVFASGVGSPTGLLVVPEPGTLSLAAIGLVAMRAKLRKCNKTN